MGSTTHNREFKAQRELDKTLEELKAEVLKKFE